MPLQRLFSRASIYQGEQSRADSHEYKYASRIHELKMRLSCIEIEKPNCIAFTIIACNRPPNSNVKILFDIYESLIKSLDNEKK